MRRLMFTFLTLLFVFTTSTCTAAPIVPYLFNIANYRGKVVYLDFWASWCGPCKFSFPYMESLANRFMGQDLVILADNLDQNSNNADAFLSQINSNIPIIYDPKAVLAKRYKVQDMPTTILFDRDGNIRYIHKGFYKSKEGEYTAHVRQLLNEK